VIRLGTRGSALALAQARWVAERLEDEVEVVVIRTSGDEGASIGDKSRWVDTIEAALVAGEIDLAVHSAKDVPGELAEGCMIVAVPEREDPRDVLVGERGPVIGTSSLRRRAQLLAGDASLQVIELRGNIDTRLRKLSEGAADGIVLAAAGLNRLGSHLKSAQVPHLEHLDAVPAPGQGSLALEGRVDDERVHSAVAAIHDPGAAAQLRAERAAAQALGASCHSAVGIHADGTRVRGFVGAPDGSHWIADEIPMTGAPEDAGRELAERMLAAGAAELLG
jgi:hydroxymethylbilane synthase